MRNDKNLAHKLRLSGKSYTEISLELGVPKSTLSDWFSSLVLSQKLREQINKKAYEKSIAGLIKRNKKQTTLAIKRMQETRRNAMKEIKVITPDNLFWAGLALYWAEGYKQPKIVKGREVTHHPIALTNSDPKLVKVFLKFLRERLAVPNEKIKADLRIFSHQNEEEIRNFWIKETDINLKNFGKSYRGISKSSMGKRPFNRLPYGVIRIHVSNTDLFHKIMGYIEGIKKLV